MTRRLTFGCAFLIASAALVYQAGCGGGPAAPMPPTGGQGGGGGANTTINILGINGANSFSPNPATVAPGQTVNWKNTDPANTHHIVADNGSFDAGSVSPGSTSNIVMVGSGPIPFHCANHPSMVGTINGSQNGGGPGGGYGYHGGH
jgi:plastocyanin